MNQHNELPDNFPGRLHVKRVAADGAPEMAPAFLRYLCRQVAQADLRDWRDWWNNEYIVERLKTQFGATNIDAVIALETEVGGAHDIAPRFAGVSVTKLERIQRRANRVVRANYLPYHDCPSNIAA